MPLYRCHNCKGISQVDSLDVRTCPMCFTVAVINGVPTFSIEDLPEALNPLPVIPPLNEITRAAFGVPDASKPDGDGDEEDICYEELGVFDQVWDMAGEHGGCDARGGAEYRRVSAIWERGGQRLVTLMFIIRHANRMTPEQAAEWTAKHLDDLFAIE